MDIRRFYYIPLRPTDTTPNLGEDFYKFTLFVKIRFFAMQITPFCRDFVHARHNTSKLGSALAYRKIRLSFVYPSYIWCISFVEVLLLLAVFVLPASTEGFVEMD